MTKEKLIDLLRSGKNKWNGFRMNNEKKALKLVEINPPRVPLTKLVWSDRFQKLVHVDLTGADLRNSDLSEAMLGLYTELINLLVRKGLSDTDLGELKAGKVYLTKAELEGVNFSGANLSGAELRETNLNEANFTNANLQDADLSESSIVNVKFNNADLSGASLRLAKMIDLPPWLLLEREMEVGEYKPHLLGTKLDNVDFSEAKLDCLDFRDIDLSRTKKFPKASLIKANLSQAGLKGADFREADLREANFLEADLTDAKLNRVKYSKVLGEKSLGRLYAFTPEFSKEADLRGSNFTRAIMRGVDLSDMDLTNSIFQGADLTNADLSGTNLTRKNFQNSNLTGANLSNSILVQTDFRNATLTNCRVHGVSAWDVKLENTIQNSLLINPPDEANITVDSIQMAQFIYLLLNRSNFRDFFDTITSKVVLILGRFTEERKVFLDAIADEVRKHNMLPVIFDFDRPASRNLIETIKSLAGMSLFIIADITNPSSSPVELHAISLNYQIPIAPIIQEGESPFSMLTDLTTTYDWVLQPITYSSKENLLTLFREEIMHRVKQKHLELEKKKGIT